MSLRCLCQGAFAAGLLLPVFPAAAAEVVETGKEVLSFNGDWEWLMILRPGSNIQLDPVTVDPDFLETWTTPAYDGPEFKPDRAPLSYGGLNFLLNGGAAPGTELFQPVSGSRGTVYCRTILDLPGVLTNVSLEMLIDDGFILYVDGTPWLRHNMSPGATSAFGQPALVAGNESGLMTLSLPDDLAAGRHTLHLSIHNQSMVSADLGFLLRITGDLTVTLPAPTLTMEPSAPSTDGTPRFLLRAKNLDPSTEVIFEQSMDLSNWTHLFTFPPPPAGTELTLDLPATAGRRFFRLTK